LLAAARFLAYVRGAPTAQKQVTEPKLRHPVEKFQYTKPSAPAGIAGWFMEAAVPVTDCVAPPPVTTTEQLVTFDAFHPSGTFPLNVTQTGVVSGWFPPGLNAPELPQAPDGVMGTINALAAQPAGAVDEVALVLVAVVEVAVLVALLLVAVLLVVVAVLLVTAVELAVVAVDERDVVVVPLLVPVVLTELFVTVEALELDDVDPLVYVPVLLPVAPVLWLLP
jgi:hypothetical protein